MNSDLRVKTSTLHHIGASMQAKLTEVDFSAALKAPGDEVLHSRLVAAALSTATNQQSARADLVRAALEEVSNSPAAAASSYLDADSFLAAKAR